MTELKKISVRMKVNFSAIPEMKALDNLQRVTPYMSDSGISKRRPTDQCVLKGERQCEDGQCIPGVDLCPEEQLMNQNTILIMIVVGLAVVIFLIVLYCFQQRTRGTQRRTPSQSNCNHDDEIHAALFMPPPTYEEVVTTDLYPPTPQMQQRRNRLPTIEDSPPMTPPPNYETALTLLARSHDSVLTKIPSVRRKSSCVSRRSLSVDFLQDQAGPGHVNVTTIDEQQPVTLEKTEKCNHNNSIKS